MNEKILIITTNFLRHFLSAEVVHGCLIKLNLQSARNMNNIFVIKNIICVISEQTI